VVPSFLIKTEALKKVVAFSKSTIEKELRQYLRDAFLDFGVDEILMTRKALHKEVFNNRYEANYLEKVLKEELRVDMFHKLDKASQMPYGRIQKGIRAETV
jgi:dephospho-CoA kinase